MPGPLLAAFFLFLTGRNWLLTATGAHEADATCGCFGNLVERARRQGLR